MAQLTAGATLAATANAQPAAAIDTLGPGRAPDDDAYWRAVRAQFLIPPDIGYMNTGSRGPSPRSVIAAQFAAINAYDSDRLSYLRNVASVEARELVRARMAEFVGCQPHEIAITTNTTEGMSIGTAGLDMQPGDEIIYTNHDHSSGAQPINLRAARYGIVPIIVDLSDKRFHPPATPEATLAAIEAAITKRTKLISFCHINYTDGCVMPVKEICALARDKGIATLVDGAHPPGMLQLDVHELGCDMYAGACHKWMLASMQTGFFFVREELLDRVWPLNYSGPVAGKSMYGEPYPPGSTLERSQTAAKFEMHGSGNFASYASVPAALDFHTTLTPQAIEARVRHMAARVRASLRDIPGVRVHVSEDPRMSAGLVSFNVGDVDPTTVNDTLWDRHRIYIRAVTHAEIGWSANRASLHVMVHDGDVDNFLGAIAELAKEHHV